MGVASGRCRSCVAWREAAIVGKQLIGEEAVALHDDDAAGVKVDMAKSPLRLQKSPVRAAHLPAEVGSLYRTDAPVVLGGD